MIRAGTCSTSAAMIAKAEKAKEPLNHGAHGGHGEKHGVFGFAVIVVCAVVNRFFSAWV